jgi:hypothetical protein
MDTDVPLLPRFCRDGRRHIMTEERVVDDPHKLVLTPSRCRSAQQQRHAERQQHGFPRETAIPGWRQAQAEDKCQEERDGAEDLQHFTKNGAHGGILAAMGGSVERV